MKTPKPRYASSANIFARRGDPWVTAREGREKFGRNVETENPDFDQYFASKAENRERFVDPKPVTPEMDYARQKVSRLRSLRMARANTIETRGEEQNHFFRPCAGCRKALCISKRACTKF